MTALMWAVKWTENPEAVSVLVEAGSPVNINDKEGNTPLKLAYERFDSEAKQKIINILKNANAKE